MAYYDKEAGRVVFGSDNRTSPATAPSSSSSYSYDSPAANATYMPSQSSYSYNSPEANATYMPTQQASGGGSQLGPLQNAVNTQQVNTNQNGQYDIDMINRIAAAVSQSLGLNKQYTSPYEAEMLNMYGKLKNYYDNPYVFDPNKDEALKVAQTQGMNRVKQDMVASGRLYSSYTDTQMQQAAQGLIPQYQQLAEQKNQQQGDNIYKQLALLQNLDNSAYSRNRDSISDSLSAFQLANDAYNNSFNRNITESGVTGYYNGTPTLAKTDSDFNKSIATAGITGNYGGQRTLQGQATDLNKINTMASLTGQVSAKDLIAQMSPEQVNSYRAMANIDGGYAAAINATNNPQTKAILTELRNQFLQANPDNPYANTISPDVMVNTLQGQQVQSALQTEAAQRAGIEISNKINQIKLDNLPEMTRLELLTAKIQADKGNAELAYQLIVNSNAPAKFKAEVDSIYANIAQGWSSIQNQKDSIALNRDEFEAKKKAGAYDSEMYNIDKQIKKDTLATNKLDKTIQRLDSMFVAKVYDPNTTAEVSKVVGDPTQMRANILNLKLSDEETDYLLSRYGLPTK